MVCSPQRTKKEIQRIMVFAGKGSFSRYLIHTMILSVLPTLQQEDGMFLKIGYIVLWDIIIRQHFVFNVLF